MCANLFAKQLSIWSSPLFQIRYNFTDKLYNSDILLIVAISNPDTIFLMERISDSRINSRWKEERFP